MLFSVNRHSLVTGSSGSTDCETHTGSVHPGRTQDRAEWVWVQWLQGQLREAVLFSVNRHSLVTGSNGSTESETHTGSVHTGRTQDRAE